VKLDRRQLLRTGAAGAALFGIAGLPGCALRALEHPGAAPRGRGEGPFRHGIASGDPLSDRVILWTRVSPRQSELSEALEVDWWIARDPDAQHTVQRGALQVGPQRDFTVKLDATGLEPGRVYYYGFSSEGVASPVGRTRTLPGDDASHVRFAVVSCANHPRGFFNAYACIANLPDQEDVDLVLQLGDYLYEHGNTGYGDGTALGRIPDPLHELISLEDYRRRHALYKRDSDLQAAHARHPWITVWDDHEIADDAWRDGADNHAAEQGEWSLRRLAAIRAYHEWMPIRDLPNGLFRSFRFGNLVDLVMLDTRIHGRDARVGGEDHAGASDSARSLLGAEQTAWLLEQLSASKRAGTRWRVIGQQVVFAPMRGASGDFNPDSWDGYRANRRQILAHLEREAIGDVVILSGDVHSAWAIDVPGAAADRDADPDVDRVAGAGSFEAVTERTSGAVEFVAPAVSSPTFGTYPGAREWVDETVPSQPHIRYSNIDENGFVILDVTRERAQAEFFFSDSVKNRSGVCHRGATFEARAGSNRLAPVPSIPSGGAEASARSAALATSAESAARGDRSTPSRP
jgi:alkaline phosphatase D